MPKKEEPEFLDRILNPEKYPYVKNKDGSVSTHRMAAETDENGNWYVFPTIQFNGEKLTRFKTNQEAMKNAMLTGNFLPMASKEEALEYAEGGYKKGTALETFNPLLKKAKTANTFTDAVE
tara:strand:- start:4384 stop:4746 length:363 start_codon:yes stop_codon:yes gene_type:complete